MGFNIFEALFYAAGFIVGNVVGQIIPQALDGKPVGWLLAVVALGAFGGAAALWYPKPVSTVDLIFLVLVVVIGIVVGFKQKSG